MKLYTLLFIGLMSCGPDDSSTTEESSELKPSLWTSEQLDMVVEACTENSTTITYESAPKTCYCFYSDMSKQYSYEVFEANVIELQEQHSEQLEQCKDQYGERI